MARVEVHADRVVVKLTRAEKLLSMRRHDIVFERALMSSVLITDDPWVWLRGVRSPGTHIPGRLAYGVWRNLSGRDFALLRKGVPAVVVDFEVPEDEAAGTGGHSDYDGFSRVILSTEHATELVQALRLTPRDEVFTTDTGA